MHKRVDVPCRIDSESVDADMLDHPPCITHQIGVRIFDDGNTSASVGLVTREVIKRYTVFRRRWISGNMVINHDKICLVRIESPVFLRR